MRNPVGVPPYPDQADETIRHAAEQLGDGSPLAWLDFIRDKLRV